MESMWRAQEREHKLTGRIKFVAEHVRPPRGMFESPVSIPRLYVEEEYKVRRKPSESWDFKIRWRRVTPIDLSHPALRWLIDGKA